jgi:hypothetical protein
MAEILGLGLTHFGGFMFSDAEMGSRITAALNGKKLPAHLKDPANWPARMREEWGSDQGATFAAKHRADYFAGLRRIRDELDAFKPDALIIFGDDQYECFREDLVPPYCIFINQRFEVKPYLRARGLGGDTPNIWNDPFDTVLRYDSAPQIAKRLVSELLHQGFDPAYAYSMPHQDYLGHAFANTLLFLDHERRGWPYPIIPFAINAYGSALIRDKGGLVEAVTDSPSAADDEPDPPGPSPQRCFDLGTAIAKALRASPWRVALVATASFSHAFLTDKNHRFFPDVAADRQRFGEIKAGNFRAWRELSLATLEDSGQHELLNWYPVIGAMAELGQKPSYCELLETYTMNSNKCVAVFPPANG